MPRRKETTAYERVDGEVVAQLEGMHRDLVAAQSAYNAQFDNLLTQLEVVRDTRADLNEVLNRTASFLDSFVQLLGNRRTG